MEGLQKLTIFLGYKATAIKFRRIGIRHYAREHYQQEQQQKPIENHTLRH